MLLEPMTDVACNCESPEAVAEVGIAVFGYSCSATGNEVAAATKSQVRLRFVTCGLAGRPSRGSGTFDGDKVSRPDGRRDTTVLDP